MNLKTPKRYRPNQRNRRVVGSWRGLRNLILVGLVAYGGYWIYGHQEDFWDAIDDLRQSSQSGIQSVQTAIPRAPTATPNVEDDMVEASNAYQQGDYERAITAYYEVLKGEPNNLEAHYRLALLLVLTSNFGANEERMNSAVDIATQAVNADPEAPDGWGIRALALVWSGSYGEAIAYAQRALEIDPNYVQAKAVLAQAYWEVGRAEQATITIDEAVAYLRESQAASAETIALVFRTKGYIAEQSLDREAAIEAYEFARRAAPHQTYITYELSLSYLGDGQTDQAISLLTSTLEENPRDTGLLLQLGRLYLNGGYAEEALQTFQQCIQTDPTAGDCYAWLGGMQFYALNFAPAISNLEFALQNGTQDLDVYWQLGRSQQQISGCTAALPYYQDGYRRAVAEENIEVRDRIAGYLSECNAPIPSGTATPSS